MNGLKRILPLVRPYRWVLFFMILTTVIPVVMELIVPRALRTIIDQGIVRGEMAVIVNGSLVMLGAALVGAMATLGQGYCRAQLSQGLAYDSRNRLFAHIQEFSFANLDRMQTGQLMTRLSSDVDMVRMFFSAGIALLLRALLMIFGSVTLMALIDWRLTLIMAGLLPAAGLVMWLVIRRAQPLFVIVQERLAALNTMVQENLAGIQVVKAFVREKYASGRFGEANIDLMEQNILVGRLMAVALPALTLLTNIGLVAAIWFGGRDTINGRLTVGELVAFSNYLMIGMAPLMLLGNMITMISRAEASAGRIWEVLDTEPAVKASAAPYEPASLRGKVAFDDVSFHYDGPGARGEAPVESTADGRSANGRRGGQNVLNEISFAVRPGQRVALLGATGSGKSSLVNLIPRFYDPTQGQVSLDGVDVRQWQPEGLRRHFGVVLQESTLFSGTIRDNIAFGRPTASLEEVMAAARIAQAHDFISALPAGYDSEVEERGANLSGGQKQRLAIARALLVGPAILILDDATSSVDLTTEAKIQQALSSSAAACTTFIVAQRISSVLNADLILVLDRGRIVAQGSHQELLASSAIYQEIYQSQLGQSQLGQSQLGRDGRPGEERP
ncbi:MAG: ABC transporter ATP-binding protein [Chloroflexota bacterium]|jgi:ATP-binding cassette subfamily B protein